MTFQDQQMVIAIGVRRFRMFVLLVVLTIASSWSTPATSAQEDNVPKRVLLKWKFKEGQKYRGKIAYGIKTSDQNPKQTTFNYDFQWEVLLDLGEEDQYLVSVKVDRIRMRHRSKAVGDGFVEYDSKKDKEFQASEVVMKELEKFLEMIRSVRGKEIQLIFDGQGEVSTVKEIPVAVLNMSPVAFPILPKNELRPGDKWEAKQGTFELKKIEMIDGHPVALIESKKDTSRFRFLVDEGRFLDGANWNITRFEPKKGEFFTQSLSTRLRYELDGALEPFNQWTPPQPQQKGRAFQFIVNSIKETPSIKENLINEKGLLSRIQNSLIIEHLDRDDYPKPSGNWRPMDWMMAARFFQRRGQLENCKQMLKGGLKSVSAIGKENSLMRDHFLMMITNKMIEVGDFDDATQAALQISSGADSETIVTGRGIVDVPKSAMKSYALLRIAIAQVKSGQHEQSLATAESIETPQTRSAAHWMIAMQLADQGKMGPATELAKTAGQLYSPQSTVIEFTKEGPTPVPLLAYRTFSLGRLAFLYALDDKQDEVRKTLAMIPRQYERDAVLTDIVISLEERGKKAMADRWAKEIPPLMYGMSATYRIVHRMGLKDAEGIEDMIETIKEPTWKVASAMNYCQALRKQGKHEQINEQIDLAQKTIDSVKVPFHRVHALTSFAAMLSDLGKNKEAKKAIQSALTTVDFKKMTIQQSVKMQMEIARLMVKLGSDSEFNDLMKSIGDEVDQLKSPEKETAKLLLIDLYLLRGEMPKAESLARQIEDHSFRCQGIAAVAKKYAISLELEKSRNVFAEAYDAAGHVLDVAGLETVYSKGGALRHVARMQGESDLEGLVYQIERSSNPNLKAYGYLAAAESLAPASAEEASKLGRQPEVVLQEICETNRACQIISGNLGPPQ